MSAGADKRVLLLGGVTEALAIARTLGPEHIYSLAGVGRVPSDLRCQVRVGGYGGAEGLAQFVRTEGIDLILDATHPYAAQISQNAATAAKLTGIHCWALRRPAWQAGPEDDWREVANWAELITALAPFKRHCSPWAASRLRTCTKSPNTSSGPCAPSTATPATHAAKSSARAGRFRLRMSGRCSSDAILMC